MRITLKAYDHQLVDASAKKIIETVKKNGAQVSGPVPLPTKKEVVTILRGDCTLSRVYPVRKQKITRCFHFSAMLFDIRCFIDAAA